MKGGFFLAYVPVPKDLTKVKTKVAFNLTKRQLIFFAAALALGLPLFFLLKNSAGTSLAAMVMIVVMLPCFLFARGCRRNGSICAVRERTNEG